RVTQTGVWSATAALAVAAGTGRLAVVHAGTTRTPAARPDGFGALVAGAATPWEAAVQTLLVLGGGAGLAAVTPHAHVLAWPGVQVGALVVAWVLRGHAVRRFGGVTGDVFGALIEVTTA